MADPRGTDMREILNTRVKYREHFRPFAASILAEHQQEFFDVDWESPYMLYALPVREAKRSVIPAVVHADGSCRFQTVSQEAAPSFHRITDQYFIFPGPMKMISPISKIIFL